MPTTDPTTLTGAASFDLLTANRITKVLLAHDDRPYPGALCGAGMLVSNTYWIAPAAWFRPAWDYLGIEPEPGAWEIADPTSRRKPALKLIETDGGYVETLLDLARSTDWPTPLTPAAVNGQQAYVRSRDGRDWLAVYHDPDGNPVPILATFLEHLGGGQPSYGYRYEGEPVLRQVPGGPGKPIGLFRERINIIDAHYEGDPGTPERRFVGSEEHPEGLQLAAVLMPQRWTF